MEVSKVLVNGQSYNLKDTKARELIDQTNKKVEYNRKKNIPLYTIIGKAIPLRPVVGYIYYTNKVKVTGKDINYFGTIKASDFHNETIEDNFVDSNNKNIVYSELVKGKVKDEDVCYVINITDWHEKQFYKIKPYTGHITINDLEIVELPHLPLASKNFTLFCNDRLVNNHKYDMFPTIVPKNYIINNISKLYQLRDIITYLYKKNNYTYKVYYTRKRTVKHNFVASPAIRSKVGQQWCLVKFNYEHYNANNIARGYCGYSYIYNKIFKVINGINPRCKRFPKIIIKKRIGHTRKYATFMTFIDE